MIKAVFASGMFGEFGNKDSLPWGHCKEDMKNFMKETEGTCLLMGAKTFMSLPSKLKNRPNIVLSTQNDTNRVMAKNGDRPDAFYHGDVSQALAELQTFHSVISVIGGMNVLEQAIDYCDEVVHTVILEQNKLECDVELSKAFTKKLTTEFWIYNADHLHDVAIAYSMKRNKKCRITIRQVNIINIGY